MRRQQAVILKFLLYTIALGVSVHWAPNNVKKQEKRRRERKRKIGTSWRWRNEEKLARDGKRCGKWVCLCVTMCIILRIEFNWIESTRHDICINRVDTICLCALLESVVGTCADLLFIGIASKCLHLFRCLSFSAPDWRKYTWQCCWFGCHLPFCIMTIDNVCSRNRMTITLWTINTTTNWFCRFESMTIRAQARQPINLPIDKRENMFIPRFNWNEITFFVWQRYVALRPWRRRQF